jgi:diacylglycerol kinase (ATP)
MAQRRNAIIIYNPRSGAHRRRDRAAEIESFRGLLLARGVDSEPWPTTGPGAATDLARRAAEAGADLVVVNGGDGTLNEALQGMVGTRVPFGIWSGGTANVLARDLGLPADPEAVADMVAGGRERRIAVGIAGERYFFLMAGIGLDASIIQGVSPALKARTGEAAFWVSGLKHFVAWHPEEFTVEVDGVSFAGAFAAVGNSPSYGGRFKVTPRASLDAAELDVAIFPTRRFAFTYTRDLIACFLGDPTRFGDVKYVKAKSLRAYGPGDAQPWVQVDGELLGPLPMRFASIPDAVTVMAPAGTP